MAIFIEGTAPSPTSPQHGVLPDAACQLVNDGIHPEYRPIARAIDHQKALQQATGFQGEMNGRLPPPFLRIFVISCFGLLGLASDE